MYRPLKGIDFFQKVKLEIIIDMLADLEKKLIFIGSSEI